MDCVEVCPVDCEAARRLPTSKLLQCAGRKTNMVAVKILDSYRSFRPTIPGTADEDDRRCQAPLKGTPSWLSLVAGPSCQFSRTIDRIAARTEDKLSLRTALLSGNHGK